MDHDEARRRIRGTPTKREDEHEEFRRGEKRITRNYDEASSDATCNEADLALGFACGIKSEL